MAKGKKQRKNEDSEDEAPASLIDSDQEEVIEAQKPAGKKGKKDRKKKKEEDLEDAQKELEAIAAGNDDLVEEEKEAKPSKKEAKKQKKNKAESEDEEEDEPKNNKKGKKKKGKKAESSDEEEMEEAPVAKKSGFAALLMDDSDDDAVDSDEAPVIIKAPEPEPKKKDKKKAKNSAPADDDFEDEGKESKKDKKKKKKKKAAADDDEDELEKALAELNIETKDDDASKSAAQKKKEKKERQKQKQLEAEKEPPKPTEKKEDTPEAGEGDETETKKGKKKDKDDGKKGKKPGKGTLLAMQEALKKVQEEQEKAKREEEERIRREEEAEKERLEKKRIEEEKKALKKQREKERKEQLRKEGKLLTAKQKADKARAEQMLAAMRAQGMEVPDTGVKRGPRPGTRIRNKNKAKSQTPEAEDQGTQAEEAAPKDAEEQPVESKEETKEVSKEEEDDVLDSWDAEPDEKEEEPKKEPEPEPKKAEKAEKEESSEEESEDESDSEEESDDDSDEESEEESDDDQTLAEKRRQRAITRIEKRRAENEANRSTDVLRAPVVVVMGHVDTGKTKILDKLRRTNVQDGEAGGITQQIGATNVPIEVIHEQCKMANDYKKETTKLPGLLIIDTPGHESFSNLRDRGSSLCDIAILVVDIMHCLEPQTIESINLLKKKKVPFVIALNKIDRLYEWKPNRHKDVKDVIDSQAANTRMEFDKRSREVITAMAEQGLNCALFFENPDPKTYISMVPTSAHSGDGMGNLMALLVKLSQTMLAKRLSFSEELQATVLEVKAIPGLGTTIDIVLVNGSLREGQTMIVAGTEGPIVTQIKALLTPSKMQDLRVKNSYLEHKEIRAAQGVKIAAKELEKTIAGLNLLVANHPDEVDLCKEEMEKRLATALSSFKVKDRGVYVQASTLGSLEALLEFLRSSKIPYAGVKIGKVVRKDIMRAMAMLEHEPKYCIILAFDVKIEPDAQKLADEKGVKIFQADIIYHLFDQFTHHQEELKRQKREEFKHVAVFPCKFKILPNFVFNSRDPIVAGCVVEAGVIKQGTPIVVPSKSFLEVGIVSSIQVNHKEVETARKGDEVCVKIDPIPGESPKMFGRHFDETDVLVSKISRASIDACKDYFRDDLQKSDWQLMVELKKVFEIL